MSDQLPFGGDLIEFIEEELSDCVPVTAALLALLMDPRAYTGGKTQPADPLLRFTHELTLSDGLLRSYLSQTTAPVASRLVDGHWRPVWKTATTESPQAENRKYDVCISFAGTDREIARRIADRLTKTHQRRVFFDEFEALGLWGENLFSHLHDIYATQSIFCVILFSHAYSQRAWTRHELRAAQTRVLEERRAYVLPVALQSNAIPTEFSATSHWPFKPGDEDDIADAVEEKVNDFIEEHFVSLDEMTESLNRDLVGSAVLDGFKRGITERTEAGNTAGAQVLKALAAIAVADAAKFTKTTRAAIDLVLFAPGPIGDAFANDNRIAVFDTASVRRWSGPQGPLLLSSEGWETHITEASRRWRRDDVEPELGPKE